MLRFAGTFFATCGLLAAGTLYSSNLVVVVNENTGAIDSVQYQGSTMFGPATGYGFQTGTDTATFQFNPAGVTVTTTGNTITVTGVYGAFQWTRSYSLTGDVLHVVMAVSNLSGQDVTLRYFGTYNPAGTDPSANTAAPGAAQATLPGSGLTVILGSSDPRAVVDLGSNGFGALLDRGIEVNWFFTGSDSGGATGDFGLAIGFEALVAGGSSLTFEYQHAYGANPAAAWAAYDSGGVPEPASAALAALGLLALAALARQRRTRRPS